MTEEKKEPTLRAVKNLAELKRLIRPGAELLITEHSKHPDIAGLIRVVTKVQTNGFYSKIKDQPDHPWSRYNNGKGGVSYFEKAKNYIFDGPNITVLDSRKNDGSVLFRFQMLEPEMAMSEDAPAQDDSETPAMGGMSL